MSNELWDRIEAVQKTCLRIILKQCKGPYISLLRRANLVTLKEMRVQISLLFCQQYRA